jgi:hypothetical protein
MFNHTLKLADTLNFLEEFDKFLIKNKKKIIIGLIGGTALELFHLRESTKDIDLLYFSKPEKEIFEFIDNYSKENEVEIDFKSSNGFQSMLLNEEMFINRNYLISEFKFSWYRKYKFKNLEIRIIEPKYFILIKLEAAATRGDRDYLDAKKIQKFFNIKYEEFLQVYKEYKIEIEIIPRVESLIKIFIKETYNIEI